MKDSLQHCGRTYAKWSRGLVFPGTGSSSSAKTFFVAVQIQSVLWSVGCWWIKHHKCRETMKTSNASSSSTKSLAFHLNICIHIYIHTYIITYICKAYGGFSNTCQKVTIQTKHFETMAGTSKRTWPCSKIKLFVSSFLATGSENCMF